MPRRWSRLHFCTIDVCDYSPESGCNGGGCGPVERPSRLERSTAPGRRYACRCAMSSRLIAQMKADSSRAIAVTITVRRLPFRSSERKRPHSLDERFHETSIHGTMSLLVDSSFGLDQTRIGTMAKWRQAVELALSDEDIAKLTAIY